MSKMIVSALLVLSLGFLGLSPAFAAPLPVFGVIASDFQDPNVPANTLDGDLGTRWSALGDGQTITYELESCDTVAAVKIAWYLGDTRTSGFDIQVSDDGVAFTTVHSGISSGDTLALQTVDIEDVSACFVRIVGHGSSANDWNSITEVVIEGPEFEGPETIPVPLAALEEICAPLFAQ